VLEGFAETLRAAQAGDERAIACLWRELQPRLLRYLSARERRAAEDVASETWLRAARDIRHFQGNEIQFRAWMFTLARHTLIDWRRRAHRRPQIGADLHEIAEQSSDDDPAADAIDALDTERVLGLINQLPEAQADVILLRVVAGLDTDRVAAIVSKRPATVRVIQHRGLRRLAELMGADARSEQGVTP
jgi:RNA polymerase sigma-70 factor (ECF subfamily)